jgi:asparagine synthase (glutamine-hydrolysing)
VIPDELIVRKKQGFGVPIREWFLQQLGALARRELDTFCRETDMFDREAIDGLFASHSAGLWPLLNLALWWKQYFADQRPFDLELDARAQVVASHPAPIPYSA